MLVLTAPGLRRGGVAGPEAMLAGVVPMGLETGGGGDWEGAGGVTAAGGGWTAGVAVADGRVAGGGSERRRGGAGEGEGERERPGEPGDPGGETGGSPPSKELL